MVLVCFKNVVGIWLERRMCCSLIHVPTTYKEALNFWVSEEVYKVDPCVKHFKTQIVQIQIPHDQPYI